MTFDDSHTLVHGAGLKCCLFQDRWKLIREPLGQKLCATNRFLREVRAHHVLTRHRLFGF